MGKIYKHDDDFGLTFEFNSVKGLIEFLLGQILGHIIFFIILFLIIDYLFL